MSQIFIPIIVLILLSTSSAHLYCKRETVATIRCRSVGTEENNPTSITFESQGETVDTIIMKKCRMKALSPGIFTNIPTAKILSLAENTISTLQDNSFATLLQLESLDLSHNMISDIKTKVFEPLKLLVELNLSHNTLKIDSQHSIFLSVLPALRILDLSTNILVDLSEIAKTTQLRSLMLSQTKVKLADKTALPSIVFLAINNAKIAKLSQILLEASADLLRLDLSFNPIKTIPPGFFTNNPKLTMLNLSHCDLASLNDDTFVTNGELLSLDLSHNKLKNIPEVVFQQNEKLVHLDLSRNSLLNIPTNIFQLLHELTTLDLSYNQLTNVHSLIFAGCTSLEVLHLDGNKLNKVGDIFSTNEGLKELSLSENLIEHLPLSTIRNLKYLKSLNLENNKLKRLEIGFVRMKALKNLCVSCNNLIALPADFFSTSEDNDLVVRLHGNPLKCSCTETLFNVETSFMFTSKHFEDGTAPMCIFSGDICNEAPISIVDLSKWKKILSLSNAGCYVK